MKPTATFGCADRRAQLGDSLLERPYSAQIKNRRADDVAPLQFGQDVARIHPSSIWAAPRVESKSRITARGVVSFLQVNDSEAQAKIFYGRAKFCCKTAQCCDTRCELRSAYFHLESALCNAEETCATR